MGSSRFPGVGSLPILILHPSIHPSTWTWAFYHTRRAPSNTRRTSPCATPPPRVRARVVGSGRSWWRTGEGKGRIHPTATLHTREPSPGGGATPVFGTSRGRRGNRNQTMEHARRIGGSAKQGKGKNLLPCTSVKGSKVNGGNGTSVRTKVGRYGIPSTHVPWTKEGNAGRNRRMAWNVQCKPSVTTAAAVSDAEKQGYNLNSHHDALANYVHAKGGKRVIRRILIANNGMAAAKAILSMRKWAFLELGDDKALQFVAMATPEDLAANAEYIRQADEFIEVPGGSNANNYANVQLIVDLALKEKVDAVWPGWGHASENPKLPEGLRKLGIQFIGPTAPVMSVLGDKIAANILAQTANVPSIPWSGDGLKADLTPEGTIPEEIFQKAMVNTVDEAVESAARIGYPVMLKASEGGGGKGIRKSTNEQELRSNFEQVKNEVPGSPMFMMQLCSQARHLEVQIVGDEYGHAVALNGRDCTTQRRFQKIFEEGPPVIAPPEVFREMERAAQRLTQNIGYIGAGTVEYLFNASTGNYFFLELNPRLQVEHPVTEGLTGVNLPATQLQVAMGISLSHIPEIRKLYGKTLEAFDDIDFMKEEYILPKKHVIAARITAENPDEGFKPTSGTIDRVNFQSSPNVWGYFSVGANGGIHEYADSQFGHLFASGNDRDEARKALMLALKDLEVRGEIRTAVEYLNQLLETEEFRGNTIDTAWLDGLIAAKGLAVGQDPQLVVAAAVLFRSHVYWKDVEASFEQALQRGQISVSSLKTQFEMEIVYQDIKYLFTVTRSGPDAFRLKLGTNVVDAKVREQSDGTLLTIFGGSSHRISGMEEPLGLRMVLDGTTCLVPVQFDPSECRSDVTGKIVRYLQAEGSMVEKGKPYAEVEAMKMVMPLVAPETGKISYNKPPGSIIDAGELLAELELANPSKAKKIIPFTGKFYPVGEGVDDQKLSSSWDTLAAFKRSLEDVKLILDGYTWDGESAVQRLLATLCDPALFPLAAKDACAAAGNKVPAWIVSRLESLSASSGEDLLLLSKEVAALNLPALEPIRILCENYSQGLWGNAVNILTDIFERYLVVEEQFAGKSFDAAVKALVKANPDSLNTVTSTVVAHLHIEDRNNLMLSILRQLPTLPQRCAGGMQSYGPIGWADDHAKLSSGMVSALERLAKLRGKEYGEVALRASNTLLEKRLPPIDVRLAELRDFLVGKKALKRKWGSAPKGDLQALVESPTLAVDLLPSLFEDDNVVVHRAALEVYVKRVYRAHNMLALDTIEQDGDYPMLVKWSFRFRDTPIDISPVRYGMLAVLKDLHDLKDRMPKVLEAYRRSLEVHCPDDMDLSTWVDPVNVLHIAMNSEDNNTDIALQVAELLHPYKNELVRLGVKFVNTLAYKKLQLPRYNTFTMTRDYEEDPLYRGSRPTVAHLLELSRLKNYDLERIATVNRDLHIYVGQGKLEEDGGRRNLRPFHLLLRRISHSRDIAKGGLERILAKAIDALQLAMLDPRAQQTSSTRLYLNVLPELKDKDFEEGVVGKLRDVMRGFITANTNELLKLRVDEIEVRLRCDIGSGIVPIRLMASSMSGQWLKLEMYREELNPVTGAAIRFCTVGEEENGTCFLDPYPITGTIQRKRAAARRIGTTYCYDFLGLVEKQLVQDWTTYLNETGSAAKMQMPPLDKLFKAEELILSQEGSLTRDPSRVVGTNQIGMVAWHCFLKTPEYPDGREIVMISNDCTVQSGSFGVLEDDFFKAASEYARVNALPRIYMACNSGARIGLVEEVKPYFKVGWNDESNPTAGFKYLYLTPDDFARFPEGTVNARKVLDESSGEVRMVLTDIIGQAHGIGVENLRGSGMIAGETSTAYTETFTLSYVTGRSVGIGAYLCRLGQRVIQMQNGPLILTGYQALNKLLGREVYTSQDQLGGPQVMMPNGITHMEVLDDREGVAAITKWLSYVPKTASSLPVPTVTPDLPNRKIAFKPLKTPYDPRSMLAGHIAEDGTWLSGFFDKGSFTETLQEWGKSVVVGRARLGGIPMGVIAVETRLMEQRIPADPANPESRETVLQQAGQVWFPDSAYKTATAIQDFNNGENLPLMIFANWRGFSGGTRDMYGEILKFGAMIVDQLRVYRQPVFIYIPPNGELRGGAWVVVDPTINVEQMEMYADTEARGGILEPPGICEVKYRAADQIRTMHRLDPVLIELDRDPQTNSVQIAEREKQLLPLYLQVAHEFADLHDRSGRMKAKGVICEALKWEDSREFFYFRVRRRLAEERIISEYVAEVPGADHAMAKRGLAELVEKKFGVDKSKDNLKVLSWLESDPRSVRKWISASKHEKTVSLVLDIMAAMDNSTRKEVLKALKK